MVDNLPENSKVFIVGGAIRSTVFRHYHSKKLAQKDYNQIITKNPGIYFDYLELTRLYLGNINKSKQKVYVYNFKVKPETKNFVDSLVFNTHIVKNDSENNNDFTVNGFVISLKDVFIEE